MNQCVIVFVTGKCSGWLVEGNRFHFNSLTLKSDQDRISPRSVNTISSRKVMSIRKMLIRGFRHSNPPNLMRCLPLSLFFYQVSPIYYKILTTKKKLLILYVFFGIFSQLPTECVYALWKVSLQLFMIFHRGHCKKNFPF